MKSPKRPRPRTARRVAGVTLAGLSSTLLLVACARAGGSVAASPTPKPAAGPRVVLPSGKTIAVEVASTPEQAAQGLMFRESMPEGNGMVFLFTGEEIRPFWMKNCHFPLDMIFTKRDGTVVDVLAAVPPCAADPCPSYPPKAKSDTVLEVNAGVAAKNGVVAGKKITYRDVPER